jgi:hypothetical protein
VEDVQVARRAAFGAVIGLVAASFALASACRAPTQARVEITTTARCDEIRGVAITAKDTPVHAEVAVINEFVNATTTDCKNGDLGSLVLVPGADTGAVVIVAGYKGQDPAKCKPPKYENCIVARRSFSYVDHTTLRIPVSLDPDCANVPCDALSTCAKGECVDAKVGCSGGDCSVDPGHTVIPDAGGVLPDGALPSDGGDGDGGPVDGGDAGGDATIGDAPSDAPLDPGLLPPLGPNLYSCGAGPGMATCSDATGGPPTLCTGKCFYSQSYGATYPIRCSPPGPPVGPPPPIMICCSQSECPGAACCAKSGRYPQCLPSAQCAQSERVCNDVGECGGGGAACLPNSGGLGAWNQCTVGD